MTQPKTKQDYILQLNTAVRLYDKQIDAANKKYPDLFILIVANLYTRYTRNATGKIWRADLVADPMAATKLIKSDADALFQDAERNGRHPRIVPVRDAFIEYRAALLQMKQLLTEGKP